MHHVDHLPCYQYHLTPLNCTLPPAQTCLPQNTSVSTPNSLWIFFADAPPINQNKTVSKVTFFIIHLVRTVCELTSSIIQTHYTRRTLFCLQLLKSFSSKDRRTCSPKAIHRVCCSVSPFLNSCCLVRVCFLGFVHSS